MQTHFLQQIQGGQQIEFIENDIAIPIFRRTQQSHRSTTSFLHPKYVVRNLNLLASLNLLEIQIGENPHDTNALFLVAPDLHLLVIDHRSREPLASLPGAQLDLDFHRLVFAAAGNKRLSRAWESQFSLVMRRFHESMERRVRTTSVRDLTVRAHTELFQAIRSGLPDEAEALARQHTTYWLSEFTQSKAFAPQFSPADSGRPTD
jgi:hypothetical protein